MDYSCTKLDDVFNPALNLIPFYITFNVARYAILSFIYEFRYFSCAKTKFHCSLTVLFLSTSMNFWL